jgi:K+ transporter
MITWQQGMRILSAVTKRDDIGLVDFIAMMAKSSVARVSGMAVFLTGHPDATAHGFAAQHQAQQSFAREQRYSECRHSRHAAGPEIRQTGLY